MVFHSTILPFFLSFYVKIAAKKGKNKLRFEIFSMPVLAGSKKWNWSTLP
jgi:hypothetical protein